MSLSSMTIPSPGQILKAEGLTPKYSFGQNFLTDPRMARRIAEAAVVGEGRKVIEIGAGLGALTDHLLEMGSTVAAVERDRELVPVLERLFEDKISTGQLHVLEADAKKLDWQETLRTLPKAEAPWVICGNLPYQITGPLIEKTVHMARQIERAAFLVQKEVADRLAAPPGSKTYGALSVFVQAQFKVKREFIVKGGAFIPPPRIESAVISLVPRPEQLTEETPAFRKVVKSAFAARRKKLKNAWKNLAADDVVQQAAEKSSISLMSRAEEIDVERFVTFTKNLVSLTDI